MVSLCANEIRESWKSVVSFLRNLGWDKTQWYGFVGATIGWGILVWIEAGRIGKVYSISQLGSSLLSFYGIIFGAIVVAYSIAAAFSLRDYRTIKKEISSVRSTMLLVIIVLLALFLFNLFYYLAIGPAAAERGAAVQFGAIVPVFMLIAYIFIGMETAISRLGKSEDN